MKCFSEFVKYNTKLIFIDLSNCGLTIPAIKCFAKLMRRAQSLRAMLFCGNPGLSLPLITWLRNRLNAKAKLVNKVIKPFKAV